MGKSYLGIFPIFSSSLPICLSKQVRKILIFNQDKAYSIVPWYQIAKSRRSCMENLISVKRSSELFLRDGFICDERGAISLRTWWTINDSLTKFHHAWLNWISLINCNFTSRLSIPLFLCPCPLTKMKTANQMKRPLIWDARSEKKVTVPISNHQILVFSLLNFETPPNTLRTPRNYVLRTLFQYCGSKIETLLIRIFPMVLLLEMFGN